MFHPSPPLLSGPVRERARTALPSATLQSRHGSLEFRADLPAVRRVQSGDRSGFKCFDVMSDCLSRMPQIYRDIEAISTVTWKTSP